MAERQDYVFGASEDIDPFAPEQMSQEDYDRIQFLADGGDAAVWIDVPTAALYLNVSRWTIYRAIDRGEIPCVRIGRVIRINRPALDKALERLAQGGGLS